MVKRILALALASALVLALTACGGGNSGNSETSNPPATSDNNNSGTSQGAGGSTAGSATGVETPSRAFSPQDVSDATIQSIETYDDYLAMYEKISLDYLTQYEDIIKNSVLDDEGAIAEAKASCEAAFEEQEGVFGAMGNMPLTDKDEIVKTLIDYRDSLKQALESIAESLG
jgi:hypothetical protein